MNQPLPDELSIGSSLPRLLLPPESDRAFEPALEGMEENATYLWLLERSRGPLLREAAWRMAALAFALYVCAVPSFSDLLPAEWSEVALLVVLTVFAAVFLSAATTATYSRVRDHFRRGRPDCLFLGRPLQAWATFAKMGLSAEDIARGIWGVRAAHSARPSHAAATFAGVASFVALAVAPFVGSSDPRPRGLACLFACFALGYAGFILGRRSNNPWSDLASAREDVAKQGNRAVGRRGDFWIGLARERESGPAGKDRPADHAGWLVMVWLLVGEGILQFAGGDLARELLAPACLGSLLAGVVLGRRAARRARINRDHEFSNLVFELDSILDVLRLGIDAPGDARSRPFRASSPELLSRSLDGSME